MHHPRGYKNPWAPSERRCRVLKHSGFCRAEVGALGSLDAMLRRLSSSEGQMLLVVPGTGLLLSQRRAGDAPVFAERFVFLGRMNMACSEGERLKDEVLNRIEEYLA